MTKILDIVLFPLRLFFLILITAFDSILGVFGLLLFNKSYKKLNHYRVWAKRLLFVAGVKVIVRGLENISPNKSYVFVANHTSYFDIPCVFVAIPFNLRIMYKKELERIPFFGWYLKFSDFVPIERDNAFASRKSIEKTISLVKENVSVLLFPEGTRSRDGRLQEFKKGALFIAQKSNKPIVPITIKGTQMILPRGSIFFRSGYVEVIVGKERQLNNNESRIDWECMMNDLRKEISDNLTIR
ncbi:MAG: 1-acyl-sn-glycerol-3-phosphate acyltransferase [Ignavibacteria bacterium]|nr:1-acyl-sn-glycerol-3-phosphate acyltransferase [Ignavibacteria bacterium]